MTLALVIVGLLVMYGCGFISGMAHVHFRRLQDDLAVLRGDTEGADER